MLANPNVSLFFVSKAYVIPEWYSVDFASVVVTGRVERVTDPAVCVRAMLSLVHRYAPENSDERNAAQMAERFPLTSIWKVTVERMEGKARAASTWVSGKTATEKDQTGSSVWLKDVK